MNIQNLCPHCMREMKDNTMKFCPRCGKNLTDKKNDPHQLQPFSFLKNKYLVGKVIGQGGFGITYIGMDTTLEMRVAIKELYPTGFCSRDTSTTTMVTIYDKKNADTIKKWQDSFLDEAKCLGKCSGLSGVVDVKEFFIENNTAYIILEYLDGMDLGQYRKAKGGTITADILLPAIEPVIIALGKVHEQGLIHRDISPDNIKCLHTGEMKLLDFGAARDYASNDEKSLSIVLKRGYAPEEQYRSKGKQGPWSDVYSLAGTIYKCLTGVTPPEAMDRMRMDELKCPSALGVELPVRVENALLKAMSVYAEDRFQSMEEFHAALYGEKTQKIPMAVKKPETTEFSNVTDGVSCKKRTGTGSIKHSESLTGNTAPRKKEKKKSSSAGIIAAAVIFVVIACAALGTLFVFKDKVLGTMTAIGQKTSADEKIDVSENVSKKTSAEKLETEIDVEVETEEKIEADVNTNEAGDFSIIVLADDTIAITGYNGEEEELLIPEKLNGKRVSLIRSLETDTVEKLTIPGCVIAVDENAVVSSSIEKITLRDGMVSLNDGAFAECEKLKEINIPKTIDYIGSAVFPKQFIEMQSESRGIYYVDGIALAIKEGETEFKWSNHTRGVAGDFWKIFHGSEELEIDTLQIPDGVEFIGKGAFRCVHALTIEVPESVVEIGKYSLGCDADKEPYSDTVLYVESGSEAEMYANENNIPFEIN